jgi:hypothetical protein
VLKTKITKAEYDALSDALKAVYKQDGDNYLLQADDAAELRTAKDRAVTEANEAKATAARLQKEKDDAEAARVAAETAAREAAARKAGDIQTLETSWQTKMDNAVAAEKARGDRLETQLKAQLVDNVAMSLANEISVSPSLLIPVITKRLQADLTGEKPLTRVLDATGAPSALNIDDLKKELVANKEFAAIIKGSNASGGGTNGQQTGGGAPAGDKKIKDMTEAERVALHRADPAAYKVRAKAEGLAVYG